MIARSALEEFYRTDAELNQLDISKECSPNEDKVKCVETLMSLLKNEKAFDAMQDNANRLLRGIIRLYRYLCEDDGRALQQLQLLRNRKCYDDIRNDEKLRDLMDNPSYSKFTDFVEVYMSNHCKKFKRLGHHLVHKMKKCLYNAEHTILHKFFNLILSEFRCPYL